MLWKHCLFCRDCLWRERTSIYSWRSPCFAGDALSRLTGDDLSRLTGDDLSCLTGDDLSRLTGDDLSRLTGDDLSRLISDALLAMLATPCWADTGMRSISQHSTVDGKSFEDKADHVARRNQIATKS
jgi:hypothetical protein